MACCVGASARGQLFDTSAAQAELVVMLMGTGRVFTANVTVKREKGDKQVKLADNVMMAREGDLRLEHKPAGDPALAGPMAKLKREKLTEVVTVLMPRAGKAYLIVPGKRAYLESVIEPTRPPRMESAFLRTELVDHHPCTVRRVTLINEDESRQQIVLWEATDMDGFVLKSQMDRGDDTREVLYFSNIRQEKPDDIQFAVPAGYGRLRGEDAGKMAKAMMEFDLEREAALAEVLR